MIKSLHRRAVEFNTFANRHKSDHDMISQMNIKFWGVFKKCINYANIGRKTSFHFSKHKIINKYVINMREGKMGI